jgi:NAD(P)-dependent dehydrogenase (short-subunit alcohol dehydrogenase family)
MARWTETDIPTLTGKRALITGAASGLGYEVAIALAKHGAQVIVADRNIEGGRAACEKIHDTVPAAQVEFRPIDLADLSVIRSFAESITDGSEPLDLLINNAGILPPLERRATRDGFELKFGINHLGHFALTGLLMPVLKRSPQPRVVTVSSLVQGWGKIQFDDLQLERHYDPQLAYNQAKLACLMFSLELASRCKAAGSMVRSMAAHPGVARTSIGEVRKTEARKHLRDYLETLSFNFAMRFMGQSADRGALPILYAATSPAATSGGFYGPDGFGQASGYPTAVKPSAAAADPLARQRLWEISEQLTGVRIAV